jgi:hypothetical protein
MYGQLLDDMFERIRDAEVEYTTKEKEKEKAKDKDKDKDKDKAKAKAKSTLKVQDGSPNRLPRQKTVAALASGTTCPAGKGKKQVRS